MVTTGCTLEFEQRQASFSGAKSGDGFYVVHQIDIEGSNPCTPTIPNNEVGTMSRS